MNFVENLKLYSNVRTVSIAIPSSIFDNTPTPLIEAYLVSQVARAAVIFNVSEIIIFNEGNREWDGQICRLVKLFEYAECPQYLRKRIFNIEPDLKYAGMIHPLEAQHHLRTSQIECPYREGVTVKHVDKEEKGKCLNFTEVEIGLNKPVLVADSLELNMRITVKVDPHDLKKIQALHGSAINTNIIANLVPPVEPVEKLNLHWGYYVRKANSLSQVLKENIFVPDKRGFYDLIVGTSEKGTIIDEIDFSKKPKTVRQEGSVKKKKLESDYNHILIVFGGIKGLEYSASCDEKLKSNLDVSSLFDYYINTCPLQGSTTIRTEEAILISLAALRCKFKLC